MKTIVHYCWVIILLVLAIHGGMVMKSEWKVRTIHRRGELVEVKIEQLDCPRQIMAFRFEGKRFEKKIDNRTCVLLNEGQATKLKHSREYPEDFQFINEPRPNWLVVGALELALGLLGMVGNWPLIRLQHKRKEKLGDASRFDPSSLYQ